MRVLRDNRYALWPFFADKCLNLRQIVARAIDKALLLLQDGATRQHPQPAIINHRGYIFHSFWSETRFGSSPQRGAMTSLLLVAAGAGFLSAQQLEPLSIPHQQHLGMDDHLVHLHHTVLVVRIVRDQLQLVFPRELQTLDE
ncbi:hypothetical protein D3C78_417450 [compost metagenome]